MTSLLNLRTFVRTELNEPTAGLWTDALLNGFINQALNELSSRVPPERTQLISTTAGVMSYSLAAPMQRVVQVFVNGAELDQSRWAVVNAGAIQTVVLGNDPGTLVSGLKVVGAGFYAALVADGDVTDLALILETALLYFSCYRAILWLAGRRDVVGLGGDSAVNNYLKLYRTEIKRHQAPARSARLEYSYE